VSGTGGGSIHVNVKTLKNFRILERDSDSIWNREMADYCAES
jgi:hypothetical protein